VHCPFHEDKTPSCSINAAKGIFKCFGCQSQDNVLEFVIFMEGGDPASKEDMYAGAQTAIDIMGRSPDDFAKQTARSLTTKLHTTGVCKRSSLAGAVPSSSSIRMSAPF
jgi:DNA primase